MREGRLVRIARTQAAGIAVRIAMPIATTKIPSPITMRQPAQLVPPES
jgi:hypothetical protein